ncbi:MAG: hypothetical protein D6762_04190 [Candidatus Neomarinimicrobiota bacterium]|nr:MAG: hypothetical protein D6762_04190 [Candidatus Neomarinimicrobiota bacterium]
MHRVIPAPFQTVRPKRSTIRTPALPDDSTAFSATSSTVKKYQITGMSASQLPFIADPYGFEASLHSAVVSPDQAELIVCLEHPEDHTAVRTVWSYATSDLSLTGKYKINSPGLDAVYTPDGTRVLVAPMDADKAGVFVVEFDRATHLETHYYLMAGNLKSHGLEMDRSGTCFYAVVNSPGDDDSFEPYNSYSYDIQRVRLINP